MTPPMLTAFASPTGGAGLPWDGPAGGHMTPPMLTAFASPRGGAGLPWDGPAEVLINNPVMRIVFVTGETS
jgi:hypothetical protein